MLRVMVRNVWSGASTAAVLMVLLLAAPVRAAEAYVDVWGSQVGTVIPLLEAPDQTGQTRTLADLAGRKGLLLFLVRSADW